MLIASFAVLLVFSAPSRAAVSETPSWRTAWAEAATASRRTCRPLLVELGAPWCDACRRMDSGVLAGSDFLRLARRMVLLRSDVDGGEGRALQKRFLAPYTPTYLLIRPDGREIGRMAGWQPEGNFLIRLSSWLKKSKEAACKPSSPKI